MPNHARQRVRTNSGLVIGNVSGQSTVIVNPGLAKATQQLWPIELCSAIFRIVEAGLQSLDQDGLQEAAGAPSLGASISSLQRAKDDLGQTLWRIRKLGAHLKLQNDSKYSKSEKAIAKLAWGCLDLATNLSTDLGRAHVDSKPMRRSAASDYSSQLRRLDEQVSVLLRKILKDSTSSLSRKLALDKSKNLRLTGRVAEDMAKATSNLTTLLDTTLIEDPPATREAVIEGVDNLRNESRDITMRNIVLESLHFPEMAERQTTVHRRGKHAHTFEWIFEPRHEDLDLHFGTWLESGEGHFWITGKAGSGKSTMLAWLYNDSRADDILVTWAGAASLVKTGFFFWNAGSPLQRSQEGLWRSILFQLLCHQNFKERAWEIIEQENILASTHTGWSVKQLLRLLELLLNSASSSARFCFLIDGLDEYTEDDSASLQDISRQLKLLASLPGVKMCIASRHWQQIEAVFADPAERTLILHQHTKADLRKYVSDIIPQDPLFDRMVRNDARYQQLTEKLVTKAEGVFLWTFYVVRDLKRSFASLPTYDEVMSFIDKCPPDLDHYYRRMMAAIPDQFKVPSSRILLMCLHARQDVSVFAFANILESAPHGDGFALILQQGANQQLAETHRERITARCLDIVEAHSAWEGWPGDVTVGYIHRTAFDYFRQDHVYKMLRQNAGDDFSPAYALCEGFLGLLQLYQARMLAEMSVHVNTSQSTVAGSPPGTSMRGTDNAAWSTRARSSSEASMRVTDGVDRPTAAGYLDSLLRSAADYEHEYNLPALKPLDAAEELLERAPRKIKKQLYAFFQTSVRQTLRAFLEGQFETAVKYESEEEAMGPSGMPNEEAVGQKWNIVLARSIQEGLTHYVRHRCAKDERLIRSVQGYPTLLLALVPHAAANDFRYGRVPELPKLDLRHRETFDLLVGLSGKLEARHVALFTYWLLVQCRRLRRTEFADLTHVGSCLVRLGVNPYRNHLSALEYASAVCSSPYTYRRFVSGGVSGLGIVRPLHIDFRLGDVLDEDQLLDIREAYRSDRSGAVAQLWSKWGGIKGRLIGTMRAWFKVPGPSMLFTDSYYTMSASSLGASTRGPRAERFPGAERFVTRR